MPQLSDGTISCASCHAPQFAFSDNHPTSEGVAQKHGTRHAPTVINSAYSPLQFWDGRVASLEEQAAGPMVNPVEMAHSLDGVVKRLQAAPKYPELFKKAWAKNNQYRSPALVSKCTSADGLFFILGECARRHKVPACAIDWWPPALRPRPFPDAGDFPPPRRYKTGTRTACRGLGGFRSSAN
jgi:hypothetical protein